MKVYAVTKNNYVASWADTVSTGTNWIKKSIINMVKYNYVCFIVIGVCAFIVLMLSGLFHPFT